MALPNRMVTDTHAEIMAYSAEEVGRRYPVIAPPNRKAITTRPAAITQRWVGWSIIGCPCQSSSTTMVGIETAKMRELDTHTSTQRDPKPTADLLDITPTAYSPRCHLGIAPVGLTVTSDCVK